MLLNLVWKRWAAVWSDVVSVYFDGPSIHPCILDCDVFATAAAAAAWIMFMEEDIATFRSGIVK